MNNKLKRAVAIIALVLVLVFTVSLILYIFDKSMLNGAIGDLAIWSGAFGILLTLVLWISHSFPSQQIKDEQRERLYKEAEEAEEAAAKQAEKGQNQEEAANENKSENSKQED